MSVCDICIFFVGGNIFIALFSLMTVLILFVLMLYVPVNISTTVLLTHLSRMEFPLLSIGAVHFHF